VNPPTATIPEDHTLTLPNGVRLLAEWRSHAPDSTDTPAEQWMLTLLREINTPRPLYVDASAAVGYWVFVVRQVLPKIQVISFEPQAELREAYRQHVVLNGLFKTGIILRGETLVAQEYDPPEADDPDQAVTARWLRWFRRSPRPAQAPPRQQARTMTLDSLVERSGLDIDLLRLDATTPDALQALDGAARAMATHRIHRCLISTPTPELHAAVAARLTANGYALRLDTPDLLVAACV
jgi:FkbM family methyltransferase